MIGAIDTGRAPGMERSAFTSGAVRKIINLTKANETAATGKDFRRHC